MNFKGAVQVDRERIEKFLDVWEDNEDWLHETMETLNNIAEDLRGEWWNNLSWVKQLLYKDVMGKDPLMWWLREKAGYKTSHYWKITDLIILDLLPPCSRWNDLNRKKDIYSNIKTLYTCGEYVYLNLEQVKLINNFLEMKPLKDVVKDWTAELTLMED